MLLRFLKAFWKVITFKQICSYCEGKGKVQLGFRGSEGESITCVVCAGKGVL